MKINEMNTMEELTAASYQEKHDLGDLIAKAREVAQTQVEYDKFVKWCRTFETPIYAGSWNKSQSMVK